MAPKLSAHEPATFFLMSGHVNSPKSDFWVKRFVPENCQGKNFWGLLPLGSLRTQDSENVVSLGVTAAQSEVMGQKPEVLQ